MDDNYLKLASYWRSSLADAESGRGAFHKDDTESFIKWENISTGCLDSKVIAQLFEGEDEDTTVVEVILRPKVFVQLLKHGKERSSGSPGIVTPLITVALVNREGFLFPTLKTSIPRDLLEPLPNGVFSIGELSLYDKYKTIHLSSAIHYDESHLTNEESEEDKQKRHQFYQDGWEIYLNDSDKLLQAVANSWINNPENYEYADYGYLIKKSLFTGASKHIISLYDHLLVSKKKVPLFQRFANLIPSDIEPNLSSDITFTDRLAHSGDKFSLARAQRDALSHFLNIDNGDILAVNGPPGTGKTTLLLSTIATLWAKAALNQSEPPVIFATSTNNQAVTNIIEAFGKDFAEGKGAMAGRWLPDLKSFGTYLPSSTKKAEASSKYQTEDFFNKIESKEYIEKALTYYTDKAKIAFPNQDCSSPAKIVTLLHNELLKQVDKLINIKEIWNSLCEISSKIDVISENIESYLHRKIKLLDEKQQEIKILKHALTEWHKFRANESLILSLFSWFPAIRNKRHYQVKCFLSEKLKSFISENSEIEIEKIEPFINKLLNDAQQKYQENQQQISHATELVKHKKQLRLEWRHIINEIAQDQTEQLELSQIDEIIDTQIRFYIFLLTTHYWEGRWLIEVSNIQDLNKEKRKNGLTAVTSRWHRRMMLTPCAVMTCYMLPSHMVVKAYNSQQKYENNYAYNFADLLIVDEAGQVLPEVAAASFALAKKALIIGDTAQIPPIWNMTPSIDIGNMLEEKIIMGNSQEQIHAEYSLISEKGKSSASGSVMKIAQFASRYHYDHELERGMYLYEHRRCLDNIISYCNELCYQGKLIPKRGDSKNSLLPAMGYLHIDGKAELKNQGSRFNLLEAEVIAAWIKLNQRNIETYYGKPIQQVVAIVTPFSAQVVTIKQALEDENIKVVTGENSLTVGTVHSLQGAERAIVIFSPVYSKHDDGGFIDSDDSLLNVAVSRAKDSFLVFGDMDLFEIQPPSSPRGLLAQFLFSQEKNALHFEYQKRKDLKKSNTEIYTLNGVTEHDNFLHNTLASMETQITIVSPWLNMKKLEQAGFMNAMLQAISKGIRIKIITDKNYNTQHVNAQKQQEKEHNLRHAINHLQTNGIEVKLVQRVHSKIVIGDNNLLCVGSFNWFSATRDTNFSVHDTSMVYDGKNLKEEIKAIYSNLDRR